ncbi:NAP domain-containing protein, partial [archaeon]
MRARTRAVCGDDRRRYFVPARRTRARTRTRTRPHAQLRIVHQAAHTARTPRVALHFLACVHADVCVCVCVCSLLPPAARLAAACRLEMESTKSLPAYEMKRLDALLELQKKHAEEHAAFVVERKALELKYIEKYNGLAAKRAAILSGAEDPAADVEGAAEHKGVEGFWLQAMQNMRILSSVIEKDDEPVLKALQDVSLEYLDDFAGFRIVFKFAPNDYFEDETLTKTIHIEHMMGSDVVGQEPSVEKLEGCDIHWKADKNLTVKTEKVTTRKKGKKVTTVKEVPQESFFR